ncbi:MAG: hypothetical protein HYR84_03740 [Planctomycetes bacterium]|nr:hypothetical protein [Planctomycetota bacterium]
MADHSGKTVAEILKTKRAAILRAPLPKGSPSWDDIMHLTWEEVVLRQKRRDRGFKAFHKLLSDKEYDK